MEVVQLPAWTGACGLAPVVEDAVALALAMSEILFLQLYWRLRARVLLFVSMCTLSALNCVLRLWRCWARAGVTTSLALTRLAGRCRTDLSDNNMQLESVP